MFATCLDHLHTYSATPSLVRTRPYAVQRSDSGKKLRCCQRKPSSTPRSDSSLRMRTWCFRTKAPAEVIAETRLCLQKLSLLCVSLRFSPPKPIISHSFPLLRFILLGGHQCPDGHILKADKGVREAPFKQIKRI